MAVNQQIGPQFNEQFPGPYFGEQNPGPYFKEQALFDDQEDGGGESSHSNQRLRPRRPRNAEQPTEGRKVRRPGVRARARRMAAAKRKREQGESDSGVFGGGKLVARIRAIQATAALATFMTPFWFVIITFWGISMLGIAAVSAINIFGFEIIDNAYAVIFVVITGILHWLTLFAAIMTFWMMRVEVTTQEQIGLFALICGFAMLPVLQIIPWVLVWCVCMIFLQTGKKSSWV